VPKGIDGVGVAVVGIGGVLMYAGIKNYSVLAVLQNAVTGKPIATNVGSPNPLTTGDTSSNIPPGPGVQDATPPGLSGNQKTGHDLAAGFGWTSADQWTALVQLWNRESSWNNRAQNPSSGAYGIPQALPYTKMPKQAWPDSAGGSSDAPAQISWGLEYIKERYGSPVIAWAHEQSNGWY
jgi:hypothetical protein